MNKVKFILGVALSISCLFLVPSCGGGGSKAAKEVVKRYKKLTQSEAYKALKMYNRVQTAYELSNYIYSPCSSCGGYGVVYYVDEYGNPICDMYGNVSLSQCPDCNGQGY